LIFLEFFGPQTIFIGEWERNLIFLDFFNLKWSKDDQIYIQTIKFRFKQINQKLITHYRPPAPVTGGITRSEWVLPLPSGPTAIFYRVGGTIRPLDGSVTVRHWNRPNEKLQIMLEVFFLTIYCELYISHQSYP
jgi:hypothetical protein